MNSDCPICRNDFDLRVQHEMHGQIPLQGIKGGEVDSDSEVLDAEEQYGQEELFERQY